MDNQHSPEAAKMANDIARYRGQPHVGSTNGLTRHRSRPSRAEVDAAWAEWSAVRDESFEPSTRSQELLRKALALHDRYHGLV